MFFGMPALLPLHQRMCQKDKNTQSMHRYVEINIWYDILRLKLIFDDNLVHIIFLYCSLIISFSLLIYFLPLYHSFIDISK